MAIIVFKLATGESIMLGTNGEDAVVKGLRLLQLVGNEDEQREAIQLLEKLGKQIQHRPI